MNYVKRICVLLAAVMLLTLAACGEKKPKDANVLQLGDYELLYKGAAIMKDSEGYDALVLTLDYTNNSDTSQSYLLSVMETAGEGGPWGMALLALYRLKQNEGQTLESWLNEQIFSGAAGSTLAPDEADRAGFAAFLQDYTACLPVEKAAGDALR